MKGIYSFYCDCGRSGSLEGVFVADSEDVAKIVGKDIYFGEVLGKHSDIQVRIDEGDIVLKSDDLKFVEMFEGVELSTGYSPFDYYEFEEDCEEYLADYHEQVGKD